MITIVHKDLHNFFADLWNDAQETGGNSRFFRPLSCWLESCTYEELPEYMKSEYDVGRIIIYPLFPKFASEEMGYDRAEALKKRRKPTKRKGWLRKCIDIFT